MRVSPERPHYIYIGVPALEEVLEYRFIWEIQTQTEEIIQCTFTRGDGRLCIEVQT